MNARQRRKALKRYGNCAYPWARVYGDNGPRRWRRTPEGSIFADTVMGWFEINRNGRSMIAAEPKTCADGATRRFDARYQFRGELEQRTLDGFTFRQAVLREVRD